jgi:ribosomal protein S18 acetylase RimI-like enzyme
MLSDERVQALPMESVIVRQMVERDLPLLEWEGRYMHFRRSFRRAYQGIRRGISVVWLAEYPQGRLIGQVFVNLFSTYRAELADGRERAYLYSIRVRDEHQNLGLGRRLMDVAETDLVERGYGVATLNVARDNVDGIRFYRRRGYEIVAPEPGRWSYLDHNGVRQQVYEPAWRMEKELGHEES